MNRFTRVAFSLLLTVMLMLPMLGLAQEYSAYDPPIIDVKGGKLRGFIDGNTYCFRGIQYATAERFEAPQPISPWEGVKDVQTYGPVCPIRDMTPYSDTAVNQDEFVWPHRYWIQDENCLNLNIWTQHIDTSAKKPVIVFFHGGGFDNGSSIEAYAYDGKNMSEFGDVVVVTVNHRLNILGMLDLSAYGEEYKYSANNTMQDLVASLQWIHDNIESFGGDPGNVMIFGQSGGSNKTVLMYHIPSAEGLFHKGSANSSGNVTTMYKGDSALVAEAILKKFSLDGTQIDKLKEIPVEDLVEAGYEALDQVGKELGRSLRWRPTYDDEYIMTKYCEFAKDLPLMFGSVFSERVGTLHKGTGKNEWTDEEVESKLTEAYGADKEAIVAEFTRLFPEKKKQDVLYYDAGRRNQVREALQLRMNATDAPVYNFLFAFEAPVNGGITPFHCAELTYVFHNAGMPECAIATGGTPECFKVQDTICQAWINFAYTSNPSQDRVEWKPYNETGNGTIVFDINTTFNILDDQKLCELMVPHM